jgi:hypothetical protein
VKAVAGVVFVALALVGGYVLVIVAITQDP